MTLRHRVSGTRALIVAGALGIALVTSAGQALELSAIPIPAALRPSLKAACLAWGSHIEELIEQHRRAHEVSEEELQNAISLFHAAKAYCSMDCFLDSLSTYEKISLGRVKSRPLW